jgi:quercetin dioxygenase-like cupin family protein
MGSQHERQERHEQNEAGVLHFARERVDEGVHVANVALRRGENSLLHKHTQTRDTFYVMAGRLTVEARVTGGEAVAPYRGVYSTPADVRPCPDFSQGSIHRVTLLPGEVLMIEPHVVHCAMNLDDEPSRFLCIEGVGTYDFVEV